VLYVAYVSWPHEFLSWPVWLVSEAIHGILKVAMALEMSGLIFKSFPAARRVGRAGIFLILAATVVSIALVRAPGFGDWAGNASGRAQYGAAFLFGWLLWLVLWYRIPLHPLHKAFLLAFVPYLLVFTVANQALSTFGMRVHWYVSYLNVVAFLGMLAYWLRVTWQQEAVTVVHPGVAKTVQPWA
jgi:hypothetical protein